MNNRRLKRARIKIGNRPLSRKEHREINRWFRHLNKMRFQILSVQASVLSILSRIKPVPKFKEGSEPLSGLAIVGAGGQEVINKHYSQCGQVPLIGIDFGSPEGDRTVLVKVEPTYYPCPNIKPIDLSECREITLPPGFQERMSKNRYMLSHFKLGGQLRPAVMPIIKDSGIV